MRSRPMVVGEIEFQNPAQVLLARDNHAIETLSAYGPQVRRDRRQFSAVGAWPTPPPSAREATPIGFWLGTPWRCRMRDVPHSSGSCGQKRRECFRPWLPYSVLTK
jgi:hypothetical protein